MTIPASIEDDGEGSAAQGDVYGVKDVVGILDGDTGEVVTF